MLYFEFEIVLHVYFTRPLASANQGSSFDYTTNRHEIAVGYTELHRLQKRASFVKQA